MRYPWLDVPVLTPTFLFFLVALAFSFIAHYAVGGGVLLAFENGRALRNDDVKYRAYLKKNAKFFVEFTSTFGIVLGLGFWFSSGMAAPFATESFVKIFAFPLAIELLLTFQSLVALFAFYYCWDKLSPRASRVLAWLYALTAWFAFALASALVSFTLNSEGVVGDWESTDDLWRALLNVQFPAQLILRTGAALMIGAFFFMIHAAYAEKDFNLRERIATRMRVPSFIGMFMLIAGVLGGGRVLSETSRLTLEGSSTSSAFACVFAVSILAILVLFVVGPCRRPREINAGQTLSLLFLAFAALGAVEGEIAIIRRPYDVDRVVYRNQLTRAEVAQARQIGILYLGTWTTYALDALQEKYPDLAISAQKYLDVDSIHLEAPVLPTAGEEGEEEGEEELEETIPDETDGTENADSYNLTTSDANVSIALFTQTVAQRSNFTPAATNPGASESSPTLNQVPTLQNPNVSNGRQNALSANGSLDVNPRLSGGATPRLAELPEPQVEVSVLSPAGSQSSPVVAPVSGNAAAPVALPNQSVQQSNRVPPVRPNAQTSRRPAPQNVEAPQNVTRQSEPVADPISPPIELDVTPASEFEPSDVVNEDSEEEKTRVLPESLDLDVNGPIARGNDDLLKVSRRDRRELGRMIFSRNCNGCHAEKHGLSAVAPRVGGRSVVELRDFVTRLNYVRFDMPPWAGTEVEAELLAEYLDSIAPKVPDSAFMKDKPKKEKEPPKAEEDESEGEGDGTEESNADGVPTSDDDSDGLIGL